MQTDLNPTAAELDQAVQAQLDYIRRLGSTPAMVMVSANQGAYEVILNLLKHIETGLPVYKALNEVQSNFSSHSGIIKRIRTLREHGLISSMPGIKGSETLLMPSNMLLAELMPAIEQKYSRSTLI